MEVMPLSQAIRLGATMKPQAFGYFIADGATCAQGAALDAIGKLDASAWHCHYEMQETWPWSYFVNHKQPSGCPLGCVDYQYDSVNSVIAHLNNIHRWSRERIADFVELHEPAAMLPDLPPVELSYEIQEVR